MAGWIAVSFLGAVASLMFLAANYRPAPPRKPVASASWALAGAHPLRSALRRLVAGVTAGASSATTGGSPARPSF